MQVRAVGLNFLDTLITRGKYQTRPPLPFSPGAEISGVVKALGAGVTELQTGQRVCGYIGWGGARELVAVPAQQLVPVPDAVSDVDAAGISVTYGTAMHGLVDRGRLVAGNSVVILGASGGAGLAAVTIAKRLGARVIAAGSSNDRLETCRSYGADDLLNYSDCNLKTALRDLTGGNGVDVVYDCVGGDYAESALRSIAWKGRYLVVGFAAGGIPRIPLNLALLKGCDICGVFWGEAVRRDPDEHRKNMQKLLGWIASGSLMPHTHGTYPMAQIADAIGVLDRREAVGKVIITV